MFNKCVGTMYMVPIPIRIYYSIKSKYVLNLFFRTIGIFKVHLNCTKNKNKTRD